MPRRKKRRAAWGALTQVDESTWRLRYWSTGPDGYRRRSKTIRGSRLDAERVRAELMLAHSNDAPCPTVGEVWRSYVLPDLERRADSGDVSTGTLKQYRLTYGKHVGPRWDGVQCDAVKPLAVQQWLYGLPLNAAKNGLMLLRQTLDYAVRYELTDRNTARERYVMPSRSTVGGYDHGTWTLEEVGELWRHVRGQWYEPAFVLAAFGGLRVGEALGVRSEDVREVTVRGVRMAVVEVVRQVTDDGPTDALKTPQSRRSVPIPGRAGAYLLGIAKARGGWLTDDGMGGTVARWRLRLSWRDAPIPPGMMHPLRNLRNAWQTWMRWTLRVPPYMIEPMMGHSVPGVTERHYDRPSAEMFAEAVADAYLAHPFDSGWNWDD